MQCCSCSAVAVHGAYDASFIVKSAVLYFYISILQSMCAVPNMAVFCSSLISCFPGMSLRYFLNDFEIVPFASIITGIINILHAGYLHLPETSHVSTEYSFAPIVAVTVHGAYNAISNVTSIVFLHQYFPKCVCSAQDGCFVGGSFFVVP